MTNLAKLLTITSKHNVSLIEEGGELKALGIILDNMPIEERINFFSDTFMMLEDEIDALYEASRDLTDEELYDVAQEEKHEYQKDIA